MREIIAAMREFRRPLVLLAAAILVLQTLVAGFGSASARIAAGGFDAGVICHGNGDPAGPNPGPAAHDCCVFCTATGPAALPSQTQMLERLEEFQTSAPLGGAPDNPLGRRAIRAGLSQAPPVVA